MTDDDAGGGADSPPPEQQTVTVEPDGYRPDEPGEQGIAAGRETAVPVADGRFDWRGWLLVGVVVVSFLVIPGIVLLRPLRIVGFRTTYLLLPLAPAVLLGATAVWVAIRSRQGER